MPTVSERAGRAAALALVAMLPLAAFANVIAYVAYAGNPLVSSDAWYFIDAFLRKAMESGPGLADFFVKRGELDHAQPLLKLLLWANAEWFGLDFVVEALMGILFAAATFLLVALTTRPDRHLQPAWSRAMLFAALALVLVTLNSGMVFDWSLVTLNYVTYFFTFLAALAAWHAVRTGRPVVLCALFAAAFLVAGAFDGVGLIVGIALVAASMLAGAKLRKWPHAWKAVAAIVAAHLAYRFFEQWFIALPSQAASGDATTSQLHAIWGLRQDWIEIVRIIFGSTFVHLNQATHYVPDAPHIAQGMFAALAVAIHGWFWWRAWKGGPNLATFYAVVVMLLFYGMSAGIVYARVPLNGIDYLHEPRYVGIYLLANVAIVLMLLGERMAPVTTWRLRVLMPAGLLALLALQVALSAYTWREGQFLYVYYHRMASQTLALGAAPGVVPEHCVALLPVCDMPLRARRNVMALLQRHRLNLYSPDFAERYGMEALVAHYVRDETAAETPTR